MFKRERRRKRSRRTFQAESPWTDTKSKASRFVFTERDAQKRDRVQSPKTGNKMEMSAQVD